jgi:hypothetical protein
VAPRPDGSRRSHAGPQGTSWLGGLPTSTGGSRGSLTRPLRSRQQPRGGSTNELAWLDALTQRLQPVYKLAKRGCAQYDKAATCFATAASIGIPIAGTSQERRFNQALDCGFAAPGKGSPLLAEAEAKGFEIKETAG